MANWARSLSEGLQTGLQMGSLLRDAKLRGALADEAAKYTPVEGAFGPDLQQNIEQVQGLQQQAIAGGMTPEQATQQYAPAIAELQRRAGLTGADYSVGGKTYGTREEAVQAAAPLRAQGLAGVYRQFGDTEKADIAEARATQAEAAGLQLRKGKRDEQQDLDALKRQEENAQWWRTRLTDAEGNPRAPGTEDFLAAAQRNAQSLIGAGKLTEAGAAFREYMTTARGQIELQSAERGEAIRKAAMALQAGDLKPVEEFYKKFVPNGANVKDFEVDAKGNVKINQVDLNGKPLPATTMTKDQLMQGLVAFNDPSKLVEYTQQSFMNNLRQQQLQLDRDKLGVTKDYYQSRAGVDKMGAAQYFTGADGNTYASVPTMGPKGLTFQTVKVNPEGVKLAKPGTDGAGSKPVKTPEAGEKYTVGGKPMQADGMGGFISAKGVLPDSRTSVMKSLGIPDNYVGELQWSNDGESVLFGDTKYSMTGKEAAKDAKQLVKDIEAADIMNMRIREANISRMNPPDVLTGLDGTVRRTGVGPRLTYPR